MTRYFDSHAHLDSGAFQADRDEILADLPAHGVARVMNVGCDLPSSARCIALAERYAGFYAAAGSHPDAAGDLTDETLAAYREMARHPKVRAIGEIGLDYHYDDAWPRQTQREAFVRQLDLAAEVRLPVICHVRDAMGEAVELVRDYAGALPGGVFHCFSGSVETAMELTRMGWYIGLTGVVTFKNARRAAEVAAAVPLDRLLIETDCPYMAPVPYRGRRNDSRYVPLIAARIAALRGIAPEAVAEATWQNASRLFGID